MKLVECLLVQRYENPKRGINPKGWGSAIHPGFLSCDVITWTLQMDHVLGFVYALLDIQKDLGAFSLVRNTR